MALSLPSRIAELEKLKDSAKKYLNNDEDFYNVLCRSCCVLMASHLEGAIKDLTASILADINYYVRNFSNFPASIQRTFCEKIAFYEGVPKPEVDARIKQLIAFFNINSVKVDLSAFSYKENLNKNPSSSFIDGIFSKMGVNDIMISISVPEIEAIFKNDIRSSYLINRDMRRYVSSLYNFPYMSLPSKYVFKRVFDPNLKKSQSLWGTFVEDLLNRRHTIVHGDTTGNPTTWEELEYDIRKLEVLIYSLIYSSTSALMVA